MTLLNSIFNTDITVDDILEKQESVENSGSNFTPLLKNVYNVTPRSDGSGSVMMRILPPLRDFKNDSPHVTLNKHLIFFKGNVYDSLCHGFFNDDCPVCKFIRDNGIHTRDYEGPLKDFKFGIYEERIPRLLNRTEHWVNVYIENDMVDPKNNGKIFQYKLPVSVFTKYMNIFKGDPNIGRKPSNPTHLLEGRPLYVKFMIKDGFRNYDESEFLDAGPITDINKKSLIEDEDFLKMVQEDTVDLYELIDPETRMYTPEEAIEKFEPIKNDILKHINGESDDLGAIGIDEVVRKDDTKLKTSDLEDLTSGKYDSGDKSATESEISDIDELLKTSDEEEDGLTDIDKLLEL